jgi:hypothetical protein
MSVVLLDGGLKIEIFFEESDREFDDDICIQIVEDCPEDERVLKFEETNLYITPDQACLLVLALQRAMDEYRASNQEP